MVTKITVEFPTKFSMEKEKQGYGMSTFKEWQDISDIAAHLEKIARLVSYIDQFPEIPVTQTIMHIMGADGVVIRTKHYTKKRRVHSFWLCYIHEEDIVSPLKTVTNE